MPFLIRPASDSAATEDPSLVHTLIEPDHNEQLILQDLQTCGWRITRHEFSDDDFVAALMHVEKDVKRRRRQTHAIAGELHGYRERPTLEDIWEYEVEGMLGESAYRVHKQKIEKTWLRATDRTRQRNDFLDYNDPDGQRPRLVTKGLDHNATDTASPPPYRHYLSNPPREHDYSYIDPSLDPVCLFYLQDCESARQRRKSVGITRPSSVSSYLHRPRSMLNIFPCRKGNTSTHTAPNSTNILRTSTFEIPSTHTDNLSLHGNYNHSDNRISDPTTTPSYLDPAITLVFPGTSTSARAYIRQTRPGTKRSSSSARALMPPLHKAGLGVDPYDWNDWYLRKQRKEDANAQLNFFLWRKRRSSNSWAKRRGEDGLIDMGPREMEREANAILARND